VPLVPDSAVLTGFGAMIRRALLAAGVAATLTLTACGDDSSGGDAGSGGGGDTVAGCVEAMTKTMEAAAEAGAPDPDSIDEEPPAECDDLSEADQQKAAQQTIQNSLGELGKQLDQLDPEQKKELEDAIEKGVEDSGNG
jgi:hypothetical protein